jgi:O-antigen ligase
MTLLGVLAVGLMVAVAYLQLDNYFVRRALAVVPRLVDGKLVVDRASSVYGRLDYYALALRLFSQRPMIGHGFYSYQALSTLFLSKFVPHAHNSYLQTLAELGTIGALALSWLILNIGHYLAYTRRLFKRHEPERLWWEFVTGSFIFLVLSAFFANPFNAPNHIGSRMISLGVLASLAKERYK